MPDDLQKLYKIMERIARSPSDNRLWDIQDVASYLNLDKSVVENKYKPLPGFPRAIRLNGNGHPRYEPADVKKWARNFKEKRVS